LIKLEKVDRPTKKLIADDLICQDFLTTPCLIMIFIILGIANMSWRSIYFYEAFGAIRWPIPDLAFATGLFTKCRQKQLAPPPSLLLAFVSFAEHHTKYGDQRLEPGGS
jgi:hypothetical protein